MSRSILFAAVPLSILALVACASPGDAPVAGGASDLTAAGTVQEASRKLYGELFLDADTNESVAYTLMGHVPSSTEACMIAIQRAGLPPKNPNAWSQVAIHPLGASAATVEAHGPVEIGFATIPSQSSSKQVLSADGNVYSETDGSARTMTMSLTFADGPRSWASVTAATIAGKDAAAKKSAACVDAKPLAELRASVYAPIAQAAADSWAKKNGEDLTDEGIELEGCSVASAAEVGCAFGNETNEETLDLTFALVDGKLGKLTGAERHSDFR